MQVSLKCCRDGRDVIAVLELCCSFRGGKLAEAGELAASATLTPA